MTRYIASRRTSALTESNDSQNRVFAMLSMKHLLSAAFATVAFAAPALAQDIAYELYNDSGYTLMEFYTSPLNDNNWGADILGAQVVPSGTGGVVTITDGSDQCAYDIRMVFDDGTETLDSVDICELGSYTIN